MTYQLEGIPLQACVLLHFICLIAIFNRISDLLALITKLARNSNLTLNIDLQQPPPRPAPVRYGQSPSDLGGWTGSVKVTPCSAAPAAPSLSAASTHQDPVTTGPTPEESTASGVKTTVSGSAPTTPPSRSFNLRRRPTSGTPVRD